MPTKVRAVRFTASTGGGTQDITIPGLGTPTGAFFIASPNTAVDSVEPNENKMIGCTDGSTQWYITTFNQNGLGSSNSGRAGHSDACIRLLSEDGSSTIAKAAFVSFITDGVRISWSVTPAAGYQVTCILFTGTLNVKAGLKDVNDTVNLGWRPDIVLMGAFLSTDGGSTNQHDLLSWGAAQDSSNSSVRNRFVSQGDRHSTGTTESNAYFGNNASAGIYLFNTQFYRTEILFNNSGFDQVTGASRSEWNYFFAVELDGVTAALRTVDSPTAAGTQTITGVGFTPQLVLTGLSALNTANSMGSSGMSGVIGMSVIDKDGANICYSFTNEDGAGTTNTESATFDQPVYLNKHDGSALFRSTFDGFNSDGWSWTFTTANTGVEGSRKFWALAIEDGGGAAVSVPVSAETVSISAPAVGVLVINPVTVAVPVETVSISAPEVGAAGATVGLETLEISTEAPNVTVQVVGGRILPVATEEIEISAPAVSVSAAASVSVSVSEQLVAINALGIAVSTSDAATVSVITEDVQIVAPAATFFTPSAVVSVQAFDIDIVAVPVTVDTGIVDIPSTVKRTASLYLARRLSIGLKGSVRMPGVRYDFKRMGNRNGNLPFN